MVFPPMPQTAAPLDDAGRSDAGVGGAAGAGLPDIAIARRARLGGRAKP